MRSPTGALFCDFCGKSEADCGGLVVSANSGRHSAVCGECALEHVKHFMDSGRLKGARLARDCKPGKRRGCIACDGEDFVCASPFPCHNLSAHHCGFAEPRGLRERVMA